MLQLDLVQTVAFAGLMLFVGYGVRHLVPPLERYNLPAPVIGGLLVALANLAARSADVELFVWDTALQTPMMIAFFTVLGFSASLGLLQAGGRQVLLFLAFSAVFAVVQNVAGALVALGFGLDPLFGVLAGSVTLTGGPATGLAFAPEFERAGVPGAATVAVAAATVGIVAGGIIGGPIGTRLVRANGLRPELRGKPGDAPDATATELIEERLVPEPSHSPPPGEDEGAYLLLKNVVAILLAMWVGSWVSTAIGSTGVRLPAYIGAMLVAAAVRNLDDRTGWIGLSQRTLDDLGNAALSLFVVLALMTLKLWELAGLAGPLFAVLAVQVALIALVCSGPVFRFFGRDYDAAVMSGGFAGFMLGTTANAMANMRTLVERFGPAPRAFLVVPLVGAFFIDFANALIITVFLNLFR